MMSHGQRGQEPKHEDDEKEKFVTVRAFSPKYCLQFFLFSFYVFGQKDKF